MGIKLVLNSDQKEALLALQKFMDHPVADTFVLKGYAGTGKTFLMQWLAGWLEEKGYKFSLLASTGRAASVLRGKTGFATKTVHSELYHFNKVEGSEEEMNEKAGVHLNGQLTLLFSLREPDSGKRIYIVDESSMLANEISDGFGDVSFGSGYLLDDFFSAVGRNKIVFVGDPGQLPPVKQLFSPALEMDWLTGQNRVVISATLEKMERNEPDNDILLFAEAIRKMNLDKNLPSYPLLPASNRNNIKLYETDRELFENYVNQFCKKGPENTIAIARSNRMVNDINRAVRRELYEQTDLPIQKDDVILVTHNNYSVPLANGDFVVVNEVKNVSELAGLRFQNILIRSILSNIEYELLISLDILYGRETNFSKLQLKMLMHEFNDRMKTNKIKFNSEKYKEAMMTDPYLNCLRAKFGYAVTCHKAQGGEWNDVYLFLEKSMYAMPKPELIRWWYTAVTRARKNLHLANNWWIR